jgi:hypothetical protein
MLLTLFLQCFRLLSVPARSIRQPVCLARLGAEGINTSKEKKKKKEEKDLEITTYALAVGHVCMFSFAFSGSILLLLLLDPPLFRPLR